MKEEGRGGEGRGGEDRRGGGGMRKKEGLHIQVIFDYRAAIILL